MLTNPAIRVVTVFGMGTLLGLATIAAKPATVLNPTSSVSGLQTVHMFSPTLGIGITGNGTIDQTTDGGARWTNVTPTGYQATGVAAFMRIQDNPVAWMVANQPNGRPTLLMTPNGGYSFHTRPIPKDIEASEVRGVVVIKVNRVLLVAVVNNKTKVFKTVDNGFRWSLVKTG